MIGICQCRIVFLKTITTVPGNVNMSIEGNTSLNKPIFCKNKTKSKAEKKNHAWKTEIGAPWSSSLAMPSRKIPAARQTVETERHKFVFLQLKTAKHSIFHLFILMKCHEKGDKTSLTGVKELMLQQNQTLVTQSAEK